MTRNESYIVAAVRSPFVAARFVASSGGA